MAWWMQYSRSLERIEELVSQMKIKVCGITRHEDACQASNLGANYLGFILHRSSPRYVSDSSIQEIRKGLETKKVCSVAVAVNPENSALVEMKKVGFDCFQLHFSSSTDLKRVEQWSGIVGKDKLWLAPRISSDENFPFSILPFAETFLVDAYSTHQFGGTGKTADWKRFKQWKKLFPDKKWFLAGGLSHKNIEDALIQAQPDGVDLNSGGEDSPGIKSKLKLEKTFSILLR